MKHCCLRMENTLKEGNLPILYSSKLREYSTPFNSCYCKNKNKNEITIVTNLHFCPWCGKKFPESLRDEWHNIIMENFKIDNILDQDELAQLPKEYLTDEWWIKRGL